VLAAGPNNLFVRDAQQQEAVYTASNKPLGCYVFLYKTSCRFATRTTSRPGYPGYNDYGYFIVIDGLETQAGFAIIAFLEKSRKNVSVSRGLKIGLNFISFD